MVVLVEPARVTDDERLGYPEGATVARHTAVTFVTGARVGVPQRAEPLCGVRRLVLVVEAVDRDGTLGLQLHEQWVLLPAGGAPRGEDIDQRYLAREVGAGQADRKSTRLNSSH